MTPEELFQIFNVFSGVIIMPIVQWIKAKLPTDFPLQAPAITLVFNCLVVWGLSALLNVPLTIAEAMPYVTLGFAGATITHASVKTIKG